MVLSVVEPLVSEGGQIVSGVSVAECPVSGPGPAVWGAEEPVWGAERLASVERPDRPSGLQVKVKR